MSYPPNAPEFWVPMENQDVIPLAATLDGVDTEAIEVAIYEPLEDRPLTAWTLFPGPLTPQVRGRYPVFIRATGNPKPASFVGFLIVF